MLKKVLAVGALAGALGLAAVPAHADASACYDVYVQVNDTVVAQAGCLP